MSMKKTVLALALLTATLAAPTQAATPTGNPAVIAPDATCLNYLSFYPGQWHARAAQHSWIFSLGRMHVVCGRNG
jgi:hypothetical protein